jgi:RNA polymerase sigma factor (sigma-70 family)
MAERDDAPESSESRLDDRDLVAACLRGDPKAWESLILRYQRLVYSIPIRAGFSPVDAADIFQSVCVTLLERLSTLRDHGKISSWLMTTTTRECYHLIARRRREGRSAIYGEDYETDILDRLAALEPLADERRLEFERQQLVREAVAALDDRCRELITLLFYSPEELSYTEIASRLKSPVNSIGPTRARCLQKLRKKLDKKI